MHQTNHSVVILCHSFVNASTLFAVILLILKMPIAREKKNWIKVAWYSFKGRHMFYSFFALICCWVANIEWMFGQTQCIHGCRSWICWIALNVGFSIIKIKLVGMYECKSEHSISIGFLKFSARHDLHGRSALSI